MSSALFSSGPLAANSLAASFKAPPEPLALPDTKLVGEHGTQTLSRLRGRTFLLSLWAEWCSACLEEAGDLASQARTYGGPNFEVIFLLTGSHKNLDLAAARTLLTKYGAGDAALLVEPNGRDVVVQALATQGQGFSLPCNVLVDLRGHVRGRMFGSSVVTTFKDGKLISKQSNWMSPAGHEFFAGLAAGALKAT